MSINVRGFESVSLASLAPWMSVPLLLIKAKPPSPGTATKPCLLWASFPNTCRARDTSAGRADGCPGVRAQGWWGEGAGMQHARCPRQAWLSQETSPMSAGPGQLLAARESQWVAVTGRVTWPGLPSSHCSRPPPDDSLDTRLELFVFSMPCLPTRSFRCRVHVLHTYPLHT